MKRQLAFAAAAALLLSEPAVCGAQADTFTLRGRVEAPKAVGAVVELYPLLDPHGQGLVNLGLAPAPKAVARTAPGEDGLFTLRASDTGPWRLRVAADGFVPREQVLLPHFGFVQHKPIELTAAEPVVVTVRNSEGAPVVGARLVTTEVDSRGRRAGQPFITFTGEGGRAKVLRPLGEGSVLRLMAWAPGQGAFQEVTVGRVAQMNVTLPDAPRRWFIVREANGEPLEGAITTFSANTLSGPAVAWPAGVTDERGGVVANWPAGEEKVRVETGRGWSASIALPPDCGSAETPCVLDLPAPMEAVGEVRNSRSSDLVSGALVWPANQPERAVTSDGRGRFILRTSPDREVGLLGATADGYMPRSFQYSDSSEPFLVELEPAIRIAGRVIDGKGNPLPGAEVRQHPNWNEQAVQTLADGAFELPPVSAANLIELRVERAGFAPVRLKPLPRDAGDMEIVMTSGGAVLGRLVDEAGEPVSEGRVRMFLLPPDGGTSYTFVDDELSLDASAVAGDEGRFSVFHLSPGRYELVVVHPEHVDRNVPLIEVPEGETIDLGNLELAPGARLSGRVVDPDGEPVAGAKLVVSPERRFRWSPHRPGETSNDQGEFEFAGLPRGKELHLTARHDEYAMTEVHGIELPRKEPMVVQLRRGSRLFGRVRGPDGEAIEDARVAATVERPYFDFNFHDISRSGRTGPDGRFEFLGLSEGRLRLTVRAEGFPGKQIDGQQLAADADLGPLEIRLDPGAEVAGRVLGPDGSPAPETYVQVEAVADGQPRSLGPLTIPRFQPAPPPSVDRTDARGEFVIQGASLGPTRVTAENDLLGDASLEIDVKPGRNPVQMALDSKGRIQGRVVDTEGNPVAGALATLAHLSDLHPSSSSTGADTEGRFVFRELDPGTYTLSAQASDLTPRDGPQSVHLADDTAPFVEIVLAPGAVIEGAIKGVPDSELARVQISAVQDDPEKAREFRHARPDFEGRYRIDGLSPGRWRVVALRPASPGAEGVVEVRGGDRPYILDLDLGGGWTLTGRVTVAGDPPSGNSILFVGSEDGEEAFTELASDGTFRVEALESGDYTLTVLQGGGTLGLHEFTLAGDDHLMIDFSTASISGRVVDHAGRPVPNASVVVNLAHRQDVNNIIGMHESDSQGTFTFEHLQPERYVVAASIEGKPVSRAAVTLEAGDRKEVELRLDSGSHLVIVPRFSSGVSAHPLQLVVVSAPGVVEFVGTQPILGDGTVVFEGIPDGSWTVLVSSRGTAMLSARIDVPGPPLSVTLTPQTVLEVVTPTLDQGAAVLSITGPDGNPPAVFLLTGEQRFMMGRRSVSALPAGTWAVSVRAPDGTRLEGTATTVPGQPTRLVLE